MGRWWSWTKDEADPFEIIDKKTCSELFDKNCTTWIDLIGVIIGKSSRKLGSGSYGTVYDIPEMNAVVKIIKLSPLKTKPNSFIWNEKCVTGIDEKSYIQKVYTRLSCDTTMCIYGIGSFDRRLYIFSEKLYKHEEEIFTSRVLFSRLLYVMGALFDEYRNSGVMHCDVSKSNIMLRSEYTPMVVRGEHEEILLHDRAVLIDWDLSVINESDSFIADNDTLRSSVNKRVLYMFPQQGSFVSVLEKCIINYVLGSGSPFLYFAHTDRDFLYDFTWFLNTFFRGMGVLFTGDDLLHRHIFMAELENLYSPLLPGIGVVDKMGYLCYSERGIHDSVEFVNDVPFHVGVINTSGVNKTTEVVRIKWKNDEDVESCSLKLGSVLWFHRHAPELSVRNDPIKFWNDRVFKPLHMLINKYN